MATSEGAALNSPTYISGPNSCKTVNDHARQRCAISILQSLEIEADDGMIGNDPGQFPSLFPQRIQLFFTWRFFFRVLAREALVLPEGFVFYGEHRCNWHVEVLSVYATLLPARMG